MSHVVVRERVQKSNLTLQGLNQWKRNILLSDASRIMVVDPEKQQ